MERHDLALNSTADQRRLCVSIRKALLCGHFMQVARKEGRGIYKIVRDDQARNVSLMSCSTLIFYTGGTASSLLFAR